MSEKCGYVAIIGRPNVGKSTLLNCILGQKLCITSRKPQTTRHQILGIKTQDDLQVIYVDTPGMHQDEKKAMNKYLNKAAFTTLQDVDVILFLVEDKRWTDEDQWILNKLSNTQIPVILAINKIDKLTDKKQLLPLLAKYNERFAFADLVPIAARKSLNIAELEKVVSKYIPEGVHQFAEDDLTDRSSRFLAAEIVREKLFRLLGEELPYATTVEIEEFKEEENLLRIGAVVWVERASQKGIVIGKQGEQLKEIGSQARVDMQKLFAQKVFLRLWVRVREGWSDDTKALESLGYTDLWN